MEAGPVHDLERERGLLSSTPVPADRRRTRVHLTDTARRAILQRASRPADDPILQAVDDPERARRVAELLDELAGLLL